MIYLGNKTVSYSIRSNAYGCYDCFHPREILLSNIGKSLILLSSIGIIIYLTHLLIKYKNQFIKRVILINIFILIVGVAVYLIEFAGLHETYVILRKSFYSMSKLNFSNRKFVENICYSNIIISFGVLVNLICLCMYFQKIKDFYKLNVKKLLVFNMIILSVSLALYQFAMVYPGGEWVKISRTWFIEKLYHSPSSFHINIYFNNILIGLLFLLNLFILIKSYKKKQIALSLVSLINTITLMTSILIFNMNYPKDIWTSNQDIFKIEKGLFSELGMGFAGEMTNRMTIYHYSNIIIFGLIMVNGMILLTSFIKKKD